MCFHKHKKEEPRAQPAKDLGRPLDFDSNSWVIDKQFEKWLFFVSRMIFIFSMLTNYRRNGDEKSRMNKTGLGQLIDILKDARYSFWVEKQPITSAFDWSMRKGVRISGRAMDVCGWNERKDTGQKNKQKEEFDHRRCAVQQKNVSFVSRSETTKK